MRDPKRIEEILVTLGHIWMKHPDQRFCQLLFNIGLAQDLFYLEDDKLQVMLDKVKKE